MPTQLNLQYCRDRAEGHISYYKGKSCNINNFRWRTDELVYVHVPQAKSNTAINMYDASSAAVFSEKKRNFIAEYQDI